MTTLTLPYPPSVNHYWVRTKWGGQAPSRRAIKYRANVEAAVVDQVGFKPCHEGELQVWINAHPPDKRERDIDNILKATLDAMQFAGLYEKDSQIKHLVIQMGESVTDGLLDVVVETME